MTTRLLRIKDVTYRTGLPKSTIYQRISEGQFPSQIKLSERASAWIESDIDDWINERISCSYDMLNRQELG